MARSRGLLIACHHLLDRTGSASGRSISSEDEVQPTISHTPHTSCTVFAPPRLPLAVAPIAVGRTVCVLSFEQPGAGPNRERASQDLGRRAPDRCWRVLGTTGKMTPKAVVRGATS